MHVLLDLDGTLTDPRDGIVRSLIHALEALGRRAPEAPSLERFIGPPLTATFAELLDTSDRALIAVAIGHYRDRFGDVGLFENRMIDGIPEALVAIGGAGHRLYLATSKPERFARRIVERFGLDRLLHGVHGSELDGTRAEKPDLLGHILALREIDAADAVMVGDRKHDVAGARANAVACIGVTWGFGGRAELAGAGADVIVDAPAALPGAIAALAPVASGDRG